MVREAKKTLGKIPNGRIFLIIYGSPKPPFFQYKNVFKIFIYKSENDIKLKKFNIKNGKMYYEKLSFRMEKT